MKATYDDTVTYRMFCYDKQWQNIWVCPKRATCSKPKFSDLLWGWQGSRPARTSHRVGKRLLDFGHRLHSDNRHQLEATTILSWSVISDLFTPSPGSRVGVPGGASGKEPTCQCRRLQRHGFDPWVRKVPWRRKWQPTPVYLPGKSQGQRALVGCSPRGCKEPDTTEGRAWQQGTRSRTGLAHQTIFCINFVPGFLGKLARRKEGHADQVDGEGFRGLRFTLSDNRLSRYIQVKLVPTLHRPQTSLFSYGYKTLGEHF